MAYLSSSLLNFTVNDLISGAMEAFNMGFDLATLLAVFGVLVDGDPLSGMLSIGGSSPSVLLGGPGGLNNRACALAICSPLHAET